MRTIGYNGRARVCPVANYQQPTHARCPLASCTTPTHCPPPGCRLWKHLNDDIRDACARAAGAAYDATAGEAAATQGAAASAAAAVADPFLRRLLSSDPASLKVVQDKLKAGGNLTTEVEAALAARAEGTKAALAALLDASSGAAAQPAGAHRVRCSCRTVLAALNDRTFVATCAIAGWCQSPIAPRQPSASHVTLTWTND